MKSIKLQIRDGKKRKQSVKLIEGKEYMIGRDSQKADIVVKNPRISRLHCCVMYDADENCLWFKDMSSNGCVTDQNELMIKNTYVKTAIDSKIAFMNTEITLCTASEKSILPYIVLADVVILLMIGSVFWIRETIENKKLTQYMQEDILFESESESDSNALE